MSATEVLCWKCMAQPGERCKTAGGRTTDTHLIRLETRYPPPGVHACKEPTLGCYRCDLNRDEMGHKGDEA